MIFDHKTIDLKSEVCTCNGQEPADGVCRCWILPYKCKILHRRSISSRSLPHSDRCANRVILFECSATLGEESNRGSSQADSTHPHMYK